MTIPVTVKGSRALLKVYTDVSVHTHEPKVWYNIGLEPTIALVGFAHLGSAGGLITTHVGGPAWSMSRTRSIEQAPAFELIFAGLRIMVVQSHPSVLRQSSKHSNVLGDTYSLFACIPRPKVLPIC